MVFDKEQSVIEAHDDTKTSTTALVSDAPVAMAASIAPASRALSIARAVSANCDMDIRRFLEQPYIAVTASITGGTTLTSTAYSIRTLLLNHPQFQKVAKTLHVRVTAVVRMVVNASPFQSGVQFMCYEPARSMCTYSDYGQAETVLTMPHVLLDINTDTEAVLKCPPCNVMPFADMYSQVPDFGTVHVGGYTPTRVGTSGPASVPYSLYVNFEDVELMAPTFQSGRVAVRKNTEKAVTLRTKGPFEDVLTASQGVAVALQRVPLLSGFMKTADWALGAAAKVAATFGWSKPLDTTAVVRHRVISSDFMANGDGVNPALPLSVSITNKLSPTDLVSLNGLDEMSIDYIKSQWGLVKRGTWSSTDISGTGIIGLYLRPRDQYIVSTIASTNTLYRHSPIAWLQNFFYFWRGGMKIRIRLAKTEFHSGRLMIAFIPGVTAVYATPVGSPCTNAESASCLTHIVDIRDTSLIEFTVPYVSSRLWCHYGEPAGFLQVRVLNPLICPETVPSTIDYVVEVCGAEDMEFAGPRAGAYKPVYAYVPGFAENQSAPVATRVVGGSSGYVGASTIGGNAQSQPMSTLPSEESIGEQVLSLKQLALCSSPFLDTTASVTDLPGLVTIGALDGAALTYRVDLLSQVLAPYRFIRGSVIYRWHQTNGATPTIAFLGFNQTSSLSTGASFNYNSRQIVVEPAQKDAIKSIMLPNYSHYSAYVNALANSAFTTTNNWVSPRVAMRLEEFVQASTRRSIYRAGGDDLQAFCFLGAPLCASGDL